MTFDKPTIQYAEVWPLLVVFGVACLGVVVEAFVPRERRYLTQSGLAAVGLVVALGGSILVGTRLDELKSAGDVVARGKLAAEGTIVVDGPSVFLWGLILVFAIGGVLLFAERRLESGVSVFAGQAAALPGTEAEREASTRGLDHTEVYPLLMFAVGGMMLFPAANDLLTMFVALEVLSLPLYLLCGLAASVADERDDGEGAHRGRAVRREVEQHRLQRADLVGAQGRGRLDAEQPGEQEARVRDRGVGEQPLHVRLDDR